MHGNIEDRGVTRQKGMCHDVLYSSGNDEDEDDDADNDVEDVDG